MTDDAAADVKLVLKPGQVLPYMSNF